MTFSRIVPLALVLIGTPSMVREPAPAPFAERLVAIGDIHGSADSLVTILQSAGLIDSGRHWVGGRARLVQTGDFLDRGAAVREVMDLLMQIEEEAKRAGGHVEVLFGNHEGMNVLRDPRDVSPDAYAAFADQESESRRTRAFSTHATLARRAGKELNRNDWLSKHPPGFIEYVQAMGPRGRYGRWIRSRKVVAKFEDSIFMHAGIAPDSKLSLEDVNRTAEREVRTFDDAVAVLEPADLIGPASTLADIVSAAGAELHRISTMVRNKEEVSPEITQEYIARLQRLLSINSWSLLAPDGPLWYRGYANADDSAGRDIAGLLQRLRAARFVVGHTVRLPGRIRTRFDNAVFLIDTGMLTTVYKGGRPAALEITDAAITAVYQDSREMLLGSPRPIVR